MRDHMDPLLGQELERMFTDLDVVSRRQRRVQPVIPPSRGCTMLVTAIVGVVVVIAAALAIQSVRPVAQPAVAPTTRAPVASQAAMLRALPKQPYGRIVHTWTEHDAANTTGPFTVTGRTVVIAAVCSGGGTISVKAPARPAQRLGCGTLTVQQPFWKFNLGGDGKSTQETAPVHVSVTVLSGSPRYIVRMWAVDPRILDASRVSVAATSASVPKSLRTCTPADLAPTGTFDRLPNRQSGVVTISSRSASDCAIRSWPSMRYLGADGKQIGPTQGVDDNGRSLDSSEGTLNKYGEFPPARLTAGGKAYLIIDLATEAGLENEDAQLKAAQATATPTPGPSFAPTPCEPERVNTVQLDVSGASISVPAPATPAPAACRTKERAFGVDPVVVDRPDGE